MSFLDYPIFITGHPKSGTSLLLSLLDGHPQLIVIPEETDFFKVIYRKYYKDLLLFFPKEKRVQNIVNRIIYSSHLRYFREGKKLDSIGGNFDYSNFDNEKFEYLLKEFLAERDFNLTNIFKSIPYALSKMNSADNDDMIGWVEKTPGNEHHFGKIKKWFPNSKMIAVVRDPRDVYCAYKKKHPNLSIDVFIDNWSESYNKIQNLKKNYRSSVLDISYEDVVKSNEDVLSEVCTFIGIRYEKHIFYPTRGGKEWHGNSMFDSKNKGIFDDSIGRYKKLIEKSTSDYIMLSVKNKVKKSDFIKNIENS